MGLESAMSDSHPFPEYDNSSVGEEEHFMPRHFYAAFTDWQVGIVVIIMSSI